MWFEAYFLGMQGKTDKNKPNLLGFTGSVVLSLLVSFLLESPVPVPVEPPLVVPFERSVPFSVVPPVTVPLEPFPVVPSVTVPSEPSVPFPVVPPVTVSFPVVPPVAVPLDPSVPFPDVPVMLPKFPVPVSFPASILSTGVDLHVLVLHTRPTIWVPGQSFDILLALPVVPQHTRERYCFPEPHVWSHSPNGAQFDHSALIASEKSQQKSTLDKRYISVYCTLWDAKR